MRRREAGAAPQGASAPAGGAGGAKQRQLRDVDLLAALQRENLPPAGVVWVAGVGAAMALWSFALVLLPPPFRSAHDRLLWAVNNDMFAVQNLGHGAFLIMFATSWWRNRNVLGLCMCQLSSWFLLFSSLAYCVVAARLEGLGAAHLAVPLVFSAVLLAALVSCSRMAREWGLMVLDPRFYARLDAETPLRLVLLLQCGLQAAEPLFALYQRVAPEAAIAALGEEARGLPALPMRGFIESYTLGFHQAFVMAVTFSSVMLEGPLREPSAVLMAVVAQLTLVAAFAVGGLTIPADPVFLTGVYAKVALHLLLAVLLTALYAQLRRRQSYVAVPAPQATAAGAFQGVAVWDLLRVAQTAAERRVLRLVLVAAALHGAAWQLQAVLSVSLSFASPRPMDAVNGMRAGLNFGMHGAGITVFVLVLALRSPVSFPFLKLAVMLGAMGGALLSGVQLVHLDDLGGADPEVRATRAFFVFRGLAGLTLFATYARLHFPETDVLDRVRALAAAKADAATAARCRRRAVAVLAVFVVAILLYAGAVTSLLRRAGVGAGFATGSGELAVQGSVKGRAFDRWHEHRLVEFPPGYGLVFHFAFLLPGFSAHYLLHEFAPSKWIGVAFASSALFILASQAALAPTTTVAPALELAACSLVPAAASLALLVELVRFTPAGGKSSAFLAGDFWH